MKRSLGVAAAMAMAVQAGSPAGASEVTEDLGSGRVAKGAVQDLLGWNNHDLQANATSMQFILSTSETQLRSWSCVDPGTGEVVGGSWAAVYTTTVALLDYETEKRRKQVTGFELQGFDGAPVVFREEDRYGGDINDPISCAEGHLVTDVVDEQGGTSSLVVNMVVLGSKPPQTLGVTAFASTILSSIGIDYRDVVLSESPDGGLVVSTGSELTAEKQDEFLYHYARFHPGVPVSFISEGWW